MKNLFFIFIFLSCTFHVAQACSMYKITKNGKTIVGNNEDWISPNSQLWYEPGENGQYGVMFMGLLNDFAQGGINEAGLMFDGFANPYLEIKNVEGKENVPIGQAVNTAMHTLKTVAEVEAYFSKINLSMLTTGMLVFVDKSGAYLIIEGDALILGNDAEKTFSNFYYSQIESIEEVELDNVKNGLKYLQSTAGESSTPYCSSVMNSLSNPSGLTQYSTIYDLEKLTIRVFLYHDYEYHVDIDLKKELAKGTTKTMIADLFPKDSKGHQHYLRYNNPKDPTWFLRDWIGEGRTEQDLIESGFPGIFNMIGYEWLTYKNDPKGAIEIFKFGTERIPSNANLFDSLGEAYMENKEYNNAIKSYGHSLSLNPENMGAIEMLGRIQALVEE